jgi:hypothetical protein
LIRVSEKDESSDDEEQNRAEKGANNKTALACGCDDLEGLSSPLDGMDARAAFLVYGCYFDCHACPSADSQLLSFKAL